VLGVFGVALERFDPFQKHVRAPPLLALRYLFPLGKIIIFSKYRDKQEKEEQVSLHVEFQEMVSPW
jgi:hypothetical protein